MVGCHRGSPVGNLQKTKTLTKLNSMQLFREAQSSVTVQELCTRNGFSIARVKNGRTPLSERHLQTQSGITDGFSSPGGGSKPGGKEMPGGDVSEVKSTFIGACSASSGCHIAGEHNDVA